jgi:hypothetical protein
MTLNTFQKGQIDKFMENHSDALFKSLCEKHKVDMDKLEDADVFNLVGEVREINENVPAGTYNKSKASPSLGSETKQAATTTTRVIQEPKAPAQKTFSNPIQKETDDEDEQKTMDDWLEDLRRCYPNHRISIRTSILKDTPELCLVKGVIEIMANGVCDFYESFGYSMKVDEGTNRLKKYMIPLSETRAVKRACRLATVGVKPDQDKKI